MDAIAEWVQAQERVIGLTAGLGAEQVDRRVPACPDWTVRELLAHMVGLDADVVAGDEPDDHNSTWTQRQVDARAGHDVAAILAEWRMLTAPLVEWMGANGTRPLGDVVIHEQDLRGALDVPGAQDTPGLLALRDRMADGFGSRVAAAGLAPAVLAGPGWTFSTGAGEPGLQLTAPVFELTRALMSRRSEAQVRGWTTAGDVGPYLSLIGGLGPLPDADLTV